MRPQSSPCVEYRFVAQARREETAYVPHERLLDGLKISLSQRLQDALAVCGALATGTARAVRNRFADFEIDVLGKSLDQLSAFRQRGATRKGRHHAGGVYLRDYADRANDVPVLFDEARAGAESGGDLFNEAPVRHARNSD
jgi:hypothetical protein